jgi:hypothetical protein
VAQAVLVSLGRSLGSPLSIGRPRALPKLGEACTSEDRANGWGRYTLAWVVSGRCDDDVGGRSGLEPALARVAAAFNWTTKSFDKILDRIDNPWVRRRPHWSDAVDPAA